MGVFEELARREFIYQVTDPGLGKILDSERLVFYAGFDPTADSLHIGNLLVIMGMVHLARAGHRPIGVVGGGTGMIGDPSGKMHERQLLSKDELAKNMQGIKAQLEHFLAMGGKGAELIMVNNGDWLQKLNFIDFLRDIGKHFRLGEMIARESVRVRMASEEGISFTEFCYQLLQAYDFHNLNRAYDCRLQVGGSDQWGNITAGIELIRSLGGKQSFGLTFPLVTTASGAKFGKTEQGTVWLDSKKTTPYQFYQYFIQTDDRDAVKYLKYFTLLPLPEIEELGALVAKTPEKREAQKKLAFEATKMAHGEDAAKLAQKASDWLFSGKVVVLTENEGRYIASEQAPSYKLSKEELNRGVGIVDLLIRAGAFPSKSEARRKINEGAVYLNNQRLQDQNYLVGINDLHKGQIILIRTGKRKYYLIVVE